MSTKKTPPTDPVLAAIEGLSRKMDEGFARVHDDIVELRGDVAALRTDLELSNKKTEVGLAALNARIDHTNESMASHFVEAEQQGAEEPRKKARGARQ
jgi:hypothetical protein